MFRRRHVFSREKRGLEVGKTKKGKGTKLMVVADGQSVPLGVLLCSASPREVTLIEATLDQVRVPKPKHGRPRKRIKRLIYDKAADSDPLRKRLKRRGVDLICPHRDGRKRPPMQDGRELRRYHRRWKIERTISWIQDFRRLVVRYHHEISMFNAYLQLACAMIPMNRL
jgi:transposase